MPHGTLHQITDTLRRTSRGIDLLADDGGRWLLDPVRRIALHPGSRVTVRGTRDGFDVLAVEEVSNAE